LLVWFFFVVLWKVEHTVPVKTSRRQTCSRSSLRPLSNDDTIHGIFTQPFWHIHLHLSIIRGTYWLFRGVYYSTAARPSSESVCLSVSLSQKSFLWPGILLQHPESLHLWAINADWTGEFLKSLWVLEFW
jgi:hypothetical protein